MSRPILLSVIFSIVWPAELEERLALLSTEIENQEERAKSAEKEG